MNDRTGALAPDDSLARAIWRIIETHQDPEAASLDFDERDWQHLLIDSERDEYRELARQVRAEAGYRIEAAGARPLVLAALLNDAIVYAHNAGGMAQGHGAGPWRLCYQRLCKASAAALGADAERTPEKTRIEAAGDGLDVDRLGRALIEHRVRYWAVEPCNKSCAPDIAAQYAAMQGLLPVREADE